LLVAVGNPSEDMAEVKFLCPIASTTKEKRKKWGSISSPIVAR